jgi:hypothetical protein
MAVSDADSLPALPLIEGGPGDVILRRLGIAPLGRRTARGALVLALVTWVPLLVLALGERLVVTGAGIPFLYDLGAHVRFLGAVPILLLAEIPIGRRVREVTAHFVGAGLVRPSDESRFRQIIVETVRLRDARVGELAVFAAAYVTPIGLLFGRASVQSGSTWYAPGATGLSLAGVWYVFVSLPIFHFLLLRWVYRLAVWATFLRKVVRLDLELTPTHPDGAGGLGFLGKGLVPLGILLFALSVSVAGAIASRVLFAGVPLDTFYLPYGALLVVAIAGVTTPVLVFVPRLAALKREALLAYGTLASRYTQAFDRKWVRGTEPAGEPLLGSADIQSLADLGNSYAPIVKMRVAPVELRDLVGIAVPGVLPALPLAATVMPVGEIVKGLLRLLA